MFKTTKQIGKRYVVKFEDGEYLSQGDKAIKLFRKRSRADTALEESYTKGVVVEVSLDEVSYPKAEKGIDVSGIRATLVSLIDKLDEGHSIDFYKALTVLEGGCNVIRHTPLGQMPVREPGDLYTDVEVHFQLRVNH